VATTKAGLEDVIAANSAICDIIGAQGKLTYRGIDIHDLARNSSFEETTYLLWFGSLPTRDALLKFSAELASHRALPTQVLTLMKDFPRTATPMDALRTGLSALAFYDPQAHDAAREANVAKAMRVTAQTATIVAAYEQIRRGRRPVDPEPDGSHAENFLRMLFGAEPDPLFIRAMDLALILHADHELNASTFAARVTAATLADMYSAIVSAIGALAGPLHGGANEQVMKMLQKIGEPSRVEAYVTKRSRASATGCTGPRTRARPTSERCRVSSVSTSATFVGTRFRASSKRSSCSRSTSMPTWTSTRLPATSRWAFRSTCLRPSSRLAGLPAGPRMFWSSTATIG